MNKGYSEFNKCIRVLSKTSRIGSFNHSLCLDYLLLSLEESKENWIQVSCTKECGKLEDADPKLEFNESECNLK